LLCDITSVGRSSCAMTLAIVKVLPEPVTPSRVWSGGIHGWPASREATSGRSPAAGRHRGLFRCGECGCFITTETQKGHDYLHCTKRVLACSQKYVREEAIAAQVGRGIDAP
jgi:hypothetical protein